MEITKSNLRIFRQDFTNTVESLQEAYDITIDMGNIIYGDEEFHFKIDVTNGNRPEAERNKFINVLKRHGWKYPALNNDSYGKEVTINHETCKIVGIKPRASKYCIVAIKESNGKSYRYTYETIKNALYNKNED